MIESDVNQSDIGQPTARHLQDDPIPTGHADPHRQPAALGHNPADSRIQRGNDHQLGRIRVINLVLVGVERLDRQRVEVGFGLQQGQVVVGQDEGELVCGREGELEEGVGWLSGGEDLAEVGG
jgi:hypothetical protein